MLTIWTYKIKHSTLGSSFSVTFSVAPNELEYLNKLYDYFNAMNMSSFYIAADRKTEPQTELPNEDCGFNGCDTFGCPSNYCRGIEDEQQTERSE